jgi:hypothetical protein
MNYLEFYDAEEDPDIAGFHRIMVTEPEHPYVAAWWPAGHGLGYEHGFTHQVVDLVTADRGGHDPRRRSPTVCRCSGCWPPWSPARSRAGGSRCRSDPRREE